MHQIAQVGILCDELALVHQYLSMGSILGCENSLREDNKNLFGKFIF